MAEFDVGIAFQLLTDTVKAGNDKLDSMAPVPPLYKVMGAASTFAAGGTQSLVIPQVPSAGRMWFIHKVVLLGADGHTAVANAVGDIYAGPAGNITADATSEIYAGIVIPTIVIEGRFHNPVLFGEQVYALLYNLPANQTVQFAIGVEEYPAPGTRALRIEGS